LLQTDRQNEIRLLKEWLQWEILVPTICQAEKEILNLVQCENISV